MSSKLKKLPSKKQSTFNVRPGGPARKVYAKADFVETSTGNKVSRKSLLCASKNIRIGGRSIIHDQVMIRGDLAEVRIGKYCVISANVLLRPSLVNIVGGDTSFQVLNIGEHVFIGEGSIVAAASIGSYVMIGKNCVISEGCILSNCCEIEDNSILPPNTIVPSFHIFGGNPANIHDSRFLPECTAEKMQDHTITYFRNLRFT
eukprot:c31595_g1_i1.p1 GENE.c31595_g1_i1~~c31595_g1_i1.p1  ORF type:complete len:211 (+),score=62.91 c31595_g1_i1:27-635(+)